jgi:hypothetical protein
MKLLFSKPVISAIVASAVLAGARAQTAPGAAAPPPPENVIRGRANPYRVAGGGDATTPGGAPSASPRPVEALTSAPPKEVVQVEDFQVLNLSLKWEVFSLPMMEAHTFLASFKTDGERYAEIAKRAEAGGAGLEELQMVRTRSGQRAKVEAIVEKIYPTAFLPPFKPAEPAREMVANPEYKPGASPANEKAKASAPSAFVAPPVTGGARGNPLPYPVPAGFETRNVGSTFEVEPTMSADGKIIDVTVAPELVRFIGNDSYTPDQSIAQPKFQTQKITTSFTARSGQPFLVGTQSPSHLSGVEGANTEKVVWLSFVTVEAVLQ